MLSTLELHYNENTIEPKILFDSITPKEQIMIRSYIHEIACENDCHPTFSPESLDLPYILSEWADKKRSLFHLLGDKLILTKKISCTKDMQAINADFRHELSSYSSPINNFISKMSSLFNHNNDFDGHKSDMFLLCSADSLRSNAPVGLYFGSEHRIVIKPSIEGAKEVYIYPNSKVIKVLGKLAKIYNIPGYEEFRIACSQITNTNTFEGTMCLSIHPLDYMTMSDNASDWTSCMSWAHMGDYCQGTVEMMNSPVVLEAYLKSDNSDMDLCYDYVNEKQFKWNNKKWRELFIVTDDIISEIKSYPYRSEELSKIVIDWIRSLFLENNNFSETLYKYNGGYEKVWFKDKEDHLVESDYNEDFFPWRFQVDTMYMYNDFGTINFHYMYISKELEADTDPTHIYYISYSGMSECMGCGEQLNDGWYDEDCACRLFCPACSSYRHCACCGRILGTDEGYYDDAGNVYCEDCFYQEAEQDILSYDYYIPEDMQEVYLVSKNIEYLDNDAYSVRTAYFKDDNDSECNWEHLLKSNYCYDTHPIRKVYYTRIGLDCVNAYSRIAINIEDLNDEGKECFGIYTEEAEQEYLDYLEEHHYDEKELEKCGAMFKF